MYYRDIASHAPVRAPSLLYGDLDARTHRFVLVLEDLGGMEAIPQRAGVGVDRARRAIREIGVFAAIEARARSPIMHLSLYADPVVGLSVVIMLLASFAMYGGVLFLPLLFQVAFGFSAAQGGALLAPMLLGTVAGGVVAGQVLSRTSGLYRIQAVICAALMTAGLFLLSTLDTSTGVGQSLIHTVIAGIGIGGIVATLSIGVQNHVPFGSVGMATSALQFHR